MLVVAGGIGGDVLPTGKFYYKYICGTKNMYTVQVCRKHSLILQHICD